MKTLLFFSLFSLLLLSPPLSHAQTLTYSGTNVGIGSPNPGQTLDIQGTVRALNFIGGVTVPYIKVTNTQASNTAGGPITATLTWTTSTLNTKDFDTANIATLSSNQISLPAGTYEVRASHPFFKTDASGTRLYNVTDSTTLLTGTSGAGGASNNTEFCSLMGGQFTITSTKTLALQYFVSTHTGNQDLGDAAGGSSEVYGQVEFWKIQ